MYTLKLICNFEAPYFFYVLCDNISKNRQDRNNLMFERHDLFPAQKIQVFTT